MWSTKVDGIPLPPTILLLSLHITLLTTEKAIFLALVKTRLALGYNRHTWYMTIDDMKIGARKERGYLKPVGGRGGEKG